jgi:hypothetical protein
MPSRIWKAFEPLQDACGPLTESLSGQRIFSSNVRQRSKKLRPPAWCKPYSHAFERSALASANTAAGTGKAFNEACLDRIRRGARHHDGDRLGRILGRLD